MSNMEHESLESGAARVKFTSKWCGSVEDALDVCQERNAEYQSLVESMADALWELEIAGATPVLPDGKVGGNATVRFMAGEPNECLIVSKSGKVAGQKMDVKNDACLVSSFDQQNWAAEYRSRCENVLPTSDTPLHFATMNAHAAFNWTEKPNVVLHGHALETVEEALKAGLPISTKETLFSTPEDTAALMELFRENPYPTHKVFIRQGHGFLVLGGNMMEALSTFRQQVKPFMRNSVTK